MSDEATIGTKSRSWKNVLRVAIGIVALSFISVCVFVKAWVEFGALPFDYGLLILSPEAMKEMPHLPPDRVLLGLGWAYAFGPAGFILYEFVEFVLRRAKMALTFSSKALIMIAIFGVSIAAPVHYYLRSLEYILVDYQTRVQVISEMKSRATKAGRPEAAAMADEILRDWITRELTPRPRVAAPN